MGRIITDEEFNKTPGTPSVVTPKKVISDEEFSNMGTAKQEDNSFMGNIKKGYQQLGNMGKAVISSEKGFGESIGQAIGAPVHAKEAEQNNARYLKAGNDMLSLAKKTLDPVKRQTYLNLSQKYFDQAGKGIQDVVGELKTTKQVLGEASGVALDVATAGTYGQAAKSAKTGQLLKPVLKSTVPTVVSKATATGAKELGKKMAGGAAIGYGYDVAGNLEQGREGADILTPGLGTLAGGVAPAAITAVGKSLSGVRNIASKEKSVEKSLSKAEQELVNIENNYSKIRKAGEYSKDNFSGSRRRLLASDVLPGSVDETGTIRTQDAIKKYKSQVIDGAEGVVRENLAKEGVSVSPNVIKLQLKKEILKSGLEGKQLKKALDSIDDEVEGLLLRSGETGNIPLTSIQDAKISAYGGINFQSNGWVKSEQKAIARAYKNVIENNSKFNVREVNKELQKYYQDLDYLELLDGRKVRGGKLGKYAAQIAGNIGGAVAGGAVGGPAGAAIGTIVGGELAGKVKGIMLSKSLGKSTGSVAEKSSILQKASEMAKAEPLKIGANHSYNLGNRNTMYNNIPTAIKTSIPKVKQKTGINAMFPQEGKESPKEVAKTILDRAKKIRPGMTIKETPDAIHEAISITERNIRALKDRGLSETSPQVKKLIRQLNNLRKL